MRFSSPQRLLMVGALFCGLVANLTVAATSSRQAAIRGKRRTQQRSLKKGDPPGKTPGPNDTQGGILSAFGDEPQLEEYPNESNIDKKDDEAKAHDSSSSSRVQLPDLFVGLGELSPSEREFFVPSDNFDPLESALEAYFQNLFSNDILGFNYVSSELEASIYTSLYFGDLSGVGTVLNFQVKGKAEFEGELPSKQSVRDQLVAYFIDWGYDNDLGAFLDSQGIERVKVTNLLVDGNQMPAFHQDLPMGEPPAQNVGQTTGNQQQPMGQTIQQQPWEPSNQDVPSSASDTATSSASTAMTSGNANAASEEPPAKGKRTGLIAGLTVFFVCLFIAALLLYSARKELASECGSWCKSGGDPKRGWHDFEEGSETAVERGDSQDDQSRSKWRSWASWFQSPHHNEQKEEPSEILRQIQVVVDNDHVLKSGAYPRSHTNPEDASGAIVSHQHSAATVPHSNFGEFDVVSPQKTACTAVSDEEESLADPVVRWAPPVRSRSKMYQERCHPIVTSPMKTSSSPSSNAPMPKPPPQLEEEDCAGLVEWVSNLNPCVLPSSMFQYESERLDDIVASIPNRDEDDGVLDTSVPTQVMRTPSAPRRKSSNRSRSSSMRRSRSRGIAGEF